MNEEKDIFRNFKGIWIPKEIYLDERLSWTERILVGEIESLDNENGCFASNAYFSKFLKVSERTISESISKLKELNYISLDCFDGRKRKLKCNFKYRCDSDQNKTSTLETKKVEEKFYHNNTCINTNNNTNTSCPEVDLLVDKKQVIEKIDYNLLANKCYSVYIRKEGKQESIKAIISAIKRLEKENKDGEWLYERIKLYSELISWKEKQFIPLASTWCNKERYFDDEQSWINPKEEQYNNESSMYPVYPMLCGEEQRKADEEYEREQQEKAELLKQEQLKIDEENKKIDEYNKRADQIMDLFK